MKESGPGETGQGSGGRMRRRAVSAREEGGEIRPEVTNVAAAIASWTRGLASICEAQARADFAPYPAAM
jgi:hypothetical protein